LPITTTSREHAQQILRIISRKSVSDTILLVRLPGVSQPLYIRRIQASRSACPKAVLGTRICECKHDRKCGMQSLRIRFWKSGL